VLLGYWTDFSKSSAKAPLYITVCGSVVQTEAPFPQGNPSYLLLLTLKGMGRYETAEKTVTLTPGRAILLLPHVSLYLRPLTKDWQISYISFNGSEAQEILAGFESGAYTAQNAEEIHSTIVEIATLPRESRQAQGRKILRNLLLSIKETFPKSKVPMEKKETESALYRMVFYIQEHFDEKITLADLARISGMGRSTVSTLFRRRFGMTPIAYITKMRYLAAEEMLKSSPELSVSEIAKRCGFQSLSYFYRNFPEGVTPIGFRKQYQKAEHLWQVPKK